MQEYWLDLPATEDAGVISDKQRHFIAINLLVNNLTHQIQEGSILLDATDLQISAELVT